MRARYHGEQNTPSDSSFSNKSLLSTTPFAATTPKSVDFMLAGLSADPVNRLPQLQQTLDALAALGRAMAEDSTSEESTIPAVFTYFGQFIDHDITKTVIAPSAQLPASGDPIQASAFEPIAHDQLPQLVSNERTAPLDLDSVYQGLALQTIDPVSGKFRIGQMTPTTFGPIATADLSHDLPRKPMIAPPRTPQQDEEDRQALIGDPRNDENLLVAQLHVAFLRSHNALIDRGLDHAAARTAIRRRYQWAVLRDFLPRICHPTVIKDMVAHGPRFWNVANPSDLFMPIEFSAAGYRFGHSMIRAEYSHNATFNPTGLARATFNRLFTFTALSGDLQPGDGPSGEFPTLPNNWPIEWHRFFSNDPEGDLRAPTMNPARRIDTNLTPELGNLRDLVGLPLTDIMAKLAARNLLRGYLFGLPTGQAVARRVGATPLAPAVLLAAIPSGLREVVQAAGLIERTPLWFYVLAEAGASSRTTGNRLGEVGSRIVAETLWNLALHATDSVVRDPPSAQELATGEFTLKGLIKIGQDRGMPPIP